MSDIKEFTDGSKGFTVKCNKCGKEISPKTLKELSASIDVYEDPNLDLSMYCYECGNGMFLENILEPEELNKGEIAYYGGGEWDTEETIAVKAAENAAQQAKDKVAKQSSNINNKLKIPRAKEIKEFLDQYVIGQDNAKKTLAVGVRNHYIRVNQTYSETREIELQKSNILMLGDSGSGKTLLAETVAKFLEVPFISTDVSSLSPSGYKGSDVEDILEKLLICADFDVTRAEKGIILLDEFDKLANNDVQASSDKGWANKIQASILKLIEGETISVSIGEGVFAKKIEIDTKNILFICAGAFQGLKEIIHKDDDKINIRNVIGFGNSIEDKLNEKEIEDKKIDSADIISYGFMQEIVGRIPIVVELSPLTKEDLIKILTEPKNSLVKQYQKILEIDGVKLKFTKKALERIAEISLDKKIGARGLRSILENIITDIIYNLPEDKYIRNCVIDEKHIIEGIMPTLRKTKKVMEG